MARATSYAPDVVARARGRRCPVLSTGHYLPLGRRCARAAAAEPGALPHRPARPAHPARAAAARRHDPARLERGRRRVLALRPRRRADRSWSARSCSGRPREPAPATPTPDARPVYLGQLHGAELPARRPGPGRRDASAGPSTTRPTGRTPPSATASRVATHAALGDGRHRASTVGRPAARARRPGRQRVLDRRARGRRARAARVGRLPRPARLAAGVLGPLRHARRTAAPPTPRPNAPTWSRPAPSPRSCGG